MREYWGTVLAIVVGLVVDVTVGLFTELNWPYLTAIALLAVLVAWLLRPRQEQPGPPPIRSLIKGNVGHRSRIRRARLKGAHHLVEGNVGDDADIDDIDMK